MSIREVTTKGNTKSQLVEIGGWLFGEANVSTNLADYADPQSAKLTPKSDRPQANRWEPIRNFNNE
jgi:hypothetical protein